MAWVPLLRLCGLGSIRVGGVPVGGEGIEMRVWRLSCKLLGWSYLNCKKWLLAVPAVT